MIVYFLYLSGFMLFLYVAFRAYLGISSVSWPTTSGIIEIVDIEERQNNNYSFYHPNVSYQYIIKSKTYKSNIVDSRFGGSTNKSEIQNLITPFKTGQKVTVYYHPVINSISFLKTGLQQKTVYAIAAIPGLTISIAGLGNSITKNNFWFIDLIFGLFRHVT